MFALASKGVTEEQIRQVLVTNQAMAADVEAAIAKAGLTTATKALTQAEMVEIAAHNGVAKADAEALLSKIGIAASETGQTAIKHQVTLAMLEQAVASGALTEAESAQLTTMLGLNAAEVTNIGITNILTASFAKLWAVITAHPLGALLTAIGAVAIGTVTYINITKKEAEKALLEAHKTAEQNLNNSKASLSNDRSELQSLTSALETIKQKIKEISSSSAPTLIKQNELNKLSATNIQLNNQISLLESTIKLKQKAAAYDAKALLETQVELKYSTILDNNSIESHNESYTYQDHAKYQMSSLQNAYNIYMKALRDGDVKKQQLGQDLIDVSSGNSAVLMSQLLEIIQNFKYDDGSIVEGYEEIYKEYMGIIYNLQLLTNPDTLPDIAKSATLNTGINYKKALSNANKLAYEGKYEIDKLDSNFVNALSTAGINESTINYIFLTKQREYALLIDKINQKYKLSEIPNKIRQDYWDDDGTGHIIVRSEYVDIKPETKKHLEEINAINGILTEYSKQNPIEFQLISSYDENFEILDKYIEQEREKAKNSTDYVGDYIVNALKRVCTEAQIENSKLNFASFSDIFSLQDAEGNLTSLGKVSESLKTIQDAYRTLSSAVAEYNDNGVISFDTLQSVISLGDDWLDYLVDENGALKLDQESLDELTRSRLEHMRVQTLNNLIDQVNQITDNAHANKYLASTNYEAAESFEELARTSALAAQNALFKKVESGDLSQAYYDAVINKMYGDINKINALFNNTSTDLSGTFSAASNTLISFTDLLDKELAVLDRKIEAGYADFNDYIRDRLSLIEDYYRQGRLSADEYYSYLEQHYDTQLSYMDKTVNAVTRRIDKEIDGLEKQKDAIEQNYQKQIDYLNEQKTLLEDASKERQRQLNLQKAQYELERAKNQRTTLIYSEDKGMHYVTDESAVKDAQQEVENAELDIQIAEIDSSVSRLEEARDAETDAIDAMIEKLEEYKEQWADISSAYEEEQENLIAAQILGQEWENDILDGRLDVLNRFKDNYIAIQQAMVDAAYQAAQAMANGEKAKIDDSSKGKQDYHWEVVDEENPSSKSKQFSTQAAAEDYARKLNRQKAAAYHMTLDQFLHSDIPGYYVRKYHTGLLQGPVKQHSFDEDFKLVRRAGLGTEDVPAILKVGEAVATPEQIHNLADSIRQSALPDFLIPLSSGYPFSQAVEHSYALPAQQSVTQNITLTCPNVTNDSGVEYIQRELGHLSLRALQESKKR